MKFIRLIIYQCLIAFVLVFGISGCTKLVTVSSPATSVTDASVYSADATAIAVLTGLYIQLSQTQYFSPGGLPTLSEYAGLSADELTLWSGANNPNSLAYYTNTLSVSAGGTEYWGLNYGNIYTCNAAIEGLTSSTTLTPSVKQQLLGESKFMRAFYYFYLVNLYGDLAVPLTTNYTSNENLPRASIAEVYMQIIADLKDAQNLLGSDFLDATLLNQSPQRIRPTKWAATALLARAYLYSGNWAGADSAASSVIGNAQFSLTSLDSVFLANSSETIWSLQPVTTGITNTQDGELFILPSSGPNSAIPNPVYLSNGLLDNFETGDQRRINWVDSVTVGTDTFYYPFKYKVNAQDTAVVEYLMMLRLGEQFLIRAEAEAEGAGNGLSAAIADLNVIRNRAGLNNTTASTQADILAAILHERQVELFTELGQRWFDLKRTKAIDAVMNLACSVKGTTWNTNQQLYPLPLLDIQEDPKLTQNPGY
ncbi:MAG: RagB/SusD family nutrient uptake outer membrane protein [Puia sp.]|nr:RagB/SusD family nutrient uptake outer membrane protein [Puia sp.]